jgi:hypothetical protein
MSPQCFMLTTITQVVLPNKLTKFMLSKRKSRIILLVSNI